MHLAHLLLATSSGGEGGGFNPIDPAAGGNLFWTWVVFLVAVPLIWKVVMEPVSKAREERDLKPGRAIAAAEKASREAEESRAKLEATLSEAQVTAARTL